MKNTAKNDIPAVREWYAFAEHCVRKAKILTPAEEIQYRAGTPDQSDDIQCVYSGTDDDVLAEARADAAKPNCGMHNFRIAREVVAMLGPTFTA